MRHSRNGFNVTIAETKQVAERRLDSPGEKGQAEAALNDLQRNADTDNPHAVAESVERLTANLDRTIREAIKPALRKARQFAEERGAAIIS